MPQIFKDHFSSVAGNYATFRPDYPRAMFEWLAGLAAERTRAWDCATGNGQAAVKLAEFFDEVVATDASSEQIANASKHEKVRYSVAPAERSGLAPNSIDLVTVAQAVHWFRFPDFFAEVTRVVKPAGVIALWCYGHIQFRDPRIHTLVNDFYENVVGPFWPPERRYIEEQYRTIPFPFQQIPAPPFCIEAAFTLGRLLGYLRTWSATQRFIQVNGFDPVESLGHQLLPVWPDGNALPEIYWPIHLRVGRLA